MTLTRQVYRAPSSARVFSVRLVVLTAFTASATNYWTFVLRLRRGAVGAFAAQTTGELLATYDLDTRSLAVGEPGVLLYDGGSGLPMLSGDSIVAVVTSTGSPAALDDPRFLVDRQLLTR